MSEWINANSMQQRLGRTVSEESRIDTLVSRIVGRPIYKTDAKLLKFVVEKKKTLSEDQSARFLEIPSIVEELKALYATTE